MQVIKDPFEQSFFIIVHIPYLQPFIDVNKRVSRLSANIPLIKNNLCPLSFIEVPEDVYLWAYERSCERYIELPGVTKHADPFQIKYHVEIRKTIQHIVLDLQPIAESNIREFSLHLVPDEDRDKFVVVIINELQALH